MLLAAIVLMVSVSSAYPARAQMFDQGTLVIMIPTGAGLVTASDSRLTLDDISCDHVEKFIEPANPDRVLLVVTGRRGIWPASILMVGDKCAFIRANRREFDLGEVAKAYMETTNVPLDRLDASALITHCLGSMKAYIEANRHRHDGTSATSRLVLASYEPSMRTSRIRVIDLSWSFMPGGQLTGREAFNLVLPPDAVAAPYVFGESEYYFDQVQPTIFDHPRPRRDQTATIRAPKNSRNDCRGRNRYCYRYD
jgi:hypothetical protein